MIIFFDMIKFMFQDGYKKALKKAQDKKIKKLQAKRAALLIQQKTITSKIEGN